MSGIFGQTAKFGQRPCLFHISNIGIKNKLTKQTVKILMRRLIRSRLIWICTVCKCVSKLTGCPNLPYFTLFINLQMVVKPKGARSIVVPPIDILLGKVPLSRKSKRKPPHARLARIERTGNQKEKKEPAGNRILG